MMKLKKLLIPDRILTILLVLYAIVAISLLRDYGEAWDNVWMYRYGKQSIEIYSHPFQTYSEYEYGPVDLRFFGPFLVTVAGLGVKVLKPIVTIWSPLDIHRLFYFLTYLTGIVFFYLLSKRFVRAWSAFLSTILLVTQPLFFGQALVNPKDTPFMAIFIGAVYFGLKVVDNLLVGEHSEAEEVAVLDKRKKRVGLIWLAALAGFLLLYQPLVLFLQYLVIEAYNSGSTTLLGRLFAMLATQASSTALENYLLKVATLVRQAGVVVFLLTFLLLFGMTLLKGLRLALKDKYILIAGILFGLTLSIRILGLLAGVVVITVVIFSTSFKKWIFPVVTYLLIALLVVYLTWPYLWAAPLERFVEALSINLGHVHSVPVFFNGDYYQSNDLPMLYVPTLIGIQFTEPLILLALLGTVWMIIQWREVGMQKLLIIGLWFVMPVIVFMVLRPSLHDNIRHILFITPPLFLLAGFFLDVILGYLGKNKLFAVMLGILFILPGVMHIARHHPYEYIYYNQFVGGTETAATQYATDYLGLSLKEGIQYLNENADSNATVYVLGQINIAEAFAREDLILIDRYDTPDTPIAGENTYLVTNESLKSSTTVKNIYQVKAGNLFLGTVQKSLGSP
jgi:4-amino-4-deoxy-L-arabinose transferase-like glycosyltransferase